YSVFFNIGDARIQASNRYRALWARCGTAGSWVTCNDVSPDIRAAVYCGAMINDDGTFFTQMSGTLQSVYQEPSPSQQERNALIEGMACTSRVLDLQ
uniref:Uncharacterized protein n=1 Tax=Panagrolaimus sp. ES5 TaxID=591445 RepID=A0AC34GMV7_9BILA